MPAEKAVYLDADGYIFVSDGRNLTNLNATNLTTGTVNDARLPATISSDITGNAATATAWATGRTLSLTGDVTGTSAAFDGSGNITLSTTIAANSVALGTDTTGNYVAVGATSGNGISGGVSSEGGTFTVTSNATDANTASTIVFRDASGNFSAGTITANLTGTASNANTLDSLDSSQFLRSDTADSTASTISFTGDIEVGDQILHNGDTDTYLQFHAADQFRVVTGDVERFEINNSDVTVQSALKEKYVALSGTTPSIDVDAGGGFSLTTSGNTTFTFTAFTSALSCGFVLQLTAGGTHTITWPASVEWAGGTAPDAPASGETDILVFWSRDGGTNWYGVLTIDAAA
jgi:hypothetical protein